MTPSLTGLLARWEQAQDAGQALDLDDLCADRPELRGTLAQAVEALARLRDLMRRTDDAAATLGPAPSAASLLQRWERSRDEGHTLSAEELAPGRPDLHPALRGALGLLAAARPADETLPPQTLVPRPTAQAAARDAATPEGYEILGELGRGGMGVVYRARQVALNRVVALKMILHGGHAGDDELARFLAEAEAIARVRHPGIVQVFDCGSVGGLPFFSLELCEGGSLADRLRESPLTPAEAAKAVAEIARAVQAAHDAGVVHRDLKPANVLLSATPQAAAFKVTDFGLAKRADGGGQTRTGDVMGTPSYVAPEQAQGKRDVGPLADVYALGAILYECLSGRPPFKAATAYETLMQAIHDEPAPLRQLNARTPRDLETACHKCLRKEPLGRYASAGELADDLGRYLAGEPIRARPVGVAERSLKWARRNRAVSALLVCLSLLTGVMAWLAYVAAAERVKADGRADDEAAARRLAQTETRRADGEKRRAEDELRRAEWLVYAGKLSLAQSAFAENEGAEALRLLAECEPAPRGWEHRHLSARFDARQTLRHGKDVSRVAWSRDGARLATAGADGVARVWDAATGREVLALRGHEGNVTGVGFSPDGSRVVTSGSDETARVWDARAGGELLVHRGHGQEVTAVAFAPDGKRVASSGRDEKARVWDATTGEKLLEVPGHGRAWPGGVAWSPEGRRLLVLTRNNTATIYDVRTGAALKVLAGHSKDLYAAAWSPDGERVATSSFDKTAVVWEAKRGQRVATVAGHTAGVTSVSFAPDGGRLLTTSIDGTAGVWEARTGRELLRLRGHGTYVRSGAWSHDGGRVVTASSDGTAKVWDAEAGQEGFAYRGHTLPVSTVAFAPDGASVLSCGSGQARLWDAGTGKDLLRLDAQSAAFLPGGRLVSIDKDDAVRVRDARTGEPLAALKSTGAAYGVTASPDGRRVATTAAEGAADVWDVATGERMFPLKGHGQFVNRVAWRRDGSRIATAGHDGLAMVWDADGGLLLTLKGHEGPVWDATFSPDGRRVATAGQDRTARVWDAADGEPLFRLEGHAMGVSSVAYSPDGSRVVTAGIDKTVKVWEAAEGRLLLTLKGHAGHVLAAAFDPDGQRVVTAGQDGTARIWDARPVARGWPEPTDDERHRRHLARGREAEDAGAWFAAAWQLEKAARLCPLDASLWVRLSHLHAEGGRRERASVCLARALLLDARVPLWPRDPEASRKGQAAAEAGDWPTAVRHFRFAVRQPGAKEGERTSLFTAQVAAKDVAAARETAAEVLRDGGEAAAYWLGAVPLTGPDAGRYVEVTARSLAKGRGPAALHNHGVALCRAGRYDEAYRALAGSVAAEGRGGYSDTWLWLAWAQAKRGRAAEASRLLARFEAWHEGRRFDNWGLRVLYPAVLAEARRAVGRVSAE